MKFSSLASSKCKCFQHQFRVVSFCFTFLFFSLGSSDLSTCQVVTEWANGCSWNEALEISGLPPGDLIRTLSRALDALRQLGNLPYTPVRRRDGAHVPNGIHPDIRRVCRDAATIINRYPLKDQFSLSIDDYEDDDDEVTNDNGVDPSMEDDEGISEGVDASRNA